MNAATFGTPNVTAIGFFVAFVALTLVITWWAARHTRSTEEYLCRRPPHQRPAEWFRAGGRLHERGELPRYRRSGGDFRIRWPDLFHRLARGLARGAVPDRRAAAQPGSLHLHRRGEFPPAAEAGADRRGAGLARGGGRLPDRPDGRCRQPDQADVRPFLRNRRGHRRPGDARVCVVRRHDRHHLGTDRQGGAAAGWRRPAGAAGAGAVRIQPAAAVRRGRRALRRGRCWLPAS